MTAGAIAADLPSPGFELHLGNAAEEADTGIGELLYVICVGSVTVLLKCISGCTSIGKYVYQPVCTYCIWFTYPYIFV